MDGQDMVPRVDVGLGPDAITEGDVTAGEMRPVAIRDRGGWSRLLDGFGYVEVSDMAAVRPQLFGLRGETLFMRTWCVHCKVEMRLPLEGRFTVTVEDGQEVVELGRGMLSVLGLRVAQRMACEPCITRLNEGEAAKDRKGRRSERVLASGIPAGLAKAVSWDSLIEKGGSPQETAHRRRAIEAAREWASKPEPGRGLLFWSGSPGTGKTRLAATAAMARLEHSPIQWISVAVLMAELSQGWNDEDRRRALQVLTSKKPIVLDDFDKFNPTPAQQSQIFAALDKREQAGSPIIVTTNENPSGLAGKLGSVFASRLLGMCSVYPYPGPDRRLEIGEA